MILPATVHLAEKAVSMWPLELKLWKTNFITDPTIGMAWFRTLLDRTLLVQLFGA